MYRRFRNAGMTIEGACAVLGQIQHEGVFLPNNAEDSKKVVDTIYTRQVDNGIITKHQFMYDGIGYGYAQWTFPDRKGMMYDFHRARGKSIGDSETQIDFLIWEMQHVFPVQWRLLTSSHDLADLSWQLLDKWENPAEKDKQKPIRYASSENFYWRFKNLNLEEESSMTKQEAVDLVLNLARSEVGYHEKASNYGLDDKTANSGGGNWNKYARDLDNLRNFYNGGKNGYAWCFTAGTLILTDTGYKNIEELKIGDRLLSAFGDSFNEILDISIHEADVVDARVFGCIPFSVTPDHPFLAEKRINKWHRNIGYRDRGYYPFSELSLHDVVTIPKSPILFENILTYDDYWVLGYYVGDGHYSAGRYKLSANETKAIEIEKHADAHREKLYSSRSCIEYELHSTGHEYLFEYLAQCGDNALTKAVPPVVLFGSAEAKKAFLDGYLTADGCMAYESFNSVSKTLVAGISRILYDLGITCSINIQERPEEGRIFDTRKNDYRYFKQQLIIYNCSMNHNPDQHYRMNIEFDTYNLVPIREKSEYTRRDYVYTIFTNGDHSYTANNISVHNCDVFYDWLFVKCFGAELGRQMLCQPLNSAGAGCLYSVQYYKQYGHWITGTPEPGDQIFFSYAPGEYSHTGLVESVSGGVVTTIEGNTSDSVGRRSYAVGSSTIAGYGRPRWELATDASSSDISFDFPTSSERVLKVGCKGEDVEELQKNLLKMGYDVGPDGADGDFGDNTRKAVMKFQREHGLMLIDGEVGDDTRKLLNEILKKPETQKEEEEAEAQPAAEPDEIPEPDTSIPRKNIQIREIKMEDNGPDVKLAQAALQCWGYTIVVTGIFGKEMDEKIRNFQAAKGLKADGEIGPLTWKELLKV